MGQASTPQAVVAELIVRSWHDASFRDRLVADPDVVVREAGLDVPAGCSVIVLVDTPSVIHIVVPRAERLGGSERDQFIAGLAQRIPLPAGVELRLHQDSEAELFVAIPVQPADLGELTDDQLAVASGAGIGGNGGAVGIVGGVGGNGGFGGNGGVGGFGGFGGVGGFGGNGGIGGNGGLLGPV